MRLELLLFESVGGRKHRGEVRAASLEDQAVALDQGVLDKEEDIVEIQEVLTLVNSHQRFSLLSFLLILRRLHIELSLNFTELKFKLPLNDLALLLYCLSGSIPLCLVGPLELSKYLGLNLGLRIIQMPSE